MDEITARAVLENARNRFYVAGAAYGLLTSEASKDMIVDYEFSLGESGFEVRPRGLPSIQGISRTVHFNRSTAQDEAHSLLEAAFQKMISDSTDAVKSFAKERGEYDLIKKEPWFAFAQHLRNAFSHNGKWHFLPNAIFPAKLNRYVLERSMHGTPARGFITYLHGTDLQAQMTFYVTGVTDYRQQHLPRP